MKPKILIKLGGASLDNANTLHELTLLIKAYQEKNFEVIVVHGGGPAINQALTEKKIDWKFINGQRQTTAEMMVVIEDVLANKVNSMIVSSLQKNNINAKSLSGTHENTLLCSQISAELLQVGKIEKVQTHLLSKTLQSNQVPVLAPIGIGFRNEKFNINADWAAAEVAVALKVDELIFLTDQDGILDQNKTLIPVLTAKVVDDLIRSEVITGGMFTKAKTMIHALHQGVQKIQILNAAKINLFLANVYSGTALVG